MGELIQGWDDIEHLEVFTPNCQTCLVAMEPEEHGWQCPNCGVVKA